MGERTNIEWTDATWNPIIGCTRPPEKLDKPLHWRKPRRISVCGMSDLFHPDVDFDFIDRVFATMALCPQHTFQVLTKRPERMLEYMTSEENYTDRYGNIMVRMSEMGWLSREELWNIAPSDVYCEVPDDPPWPLPNVWLGVSVEDQCRADERIPLLLQVPAAMRWISMEPLLGPVDLTYPQSIYPSGPPRCCDGHECGCMGLPAEPPLLYGIDWVVVGGESGPDARPMHPDWVRSIRDQCQAAGVPFLFKQWGTWLPNAQEYGCYQEGANYNRPHVLIGNVTMARVGKQAAGRLLDGRTWDEYPMGVL